MTESHQESCAESRIRHESAGMSFASSGLSWDVEEEDSEKGVGSSNTPSRASTTRHLSFGEQVGESLSGDPSRTENYVDGKTTVPADQERQVLLLMLLAQVCALHDPTPRTFTAHVLELFERGILDRQSISFLFELGLVPSLSPAKLLLPSSEQENSSHHHELALIAGSIPTRSVEASAIRSRLEEQETRRLSRQISTQSEPTPTKRSISFSAEHHPLSLSRYQREFKQVKLLSSGSFGYVYQATNKMDGRDYAIKQVPFNATGYSRDSVQQVVREVHCLAVCDHPHVVRYYTSWLEPSWMTGTGNNAAAHPEQHQKLLTDIQQLVANGEGSSSEAASDDLQDYFKSTNLSPRRRRYSLGDRLDEESESFWIGEDECSEWTTTNDVERCKDDSYLDQRWQSRRPSTQGDNTWNEQVDNRHEKRRSEGSYRYQICLFIQMQLCSPMTLADWIRKRNEKLPDQTIASRIDAASEIFSQIASGLSHVHKKNIIHRDIKPANVFASNDDGEINFKLGDFGLSKLIMCACDNNSGSFGRGRMSEQGQLLLEFQETNNSPISPQDSWQDPLTAGVGTASYAAPEQVASRKYGKAADIFSIGLMLIELLSCFSTEHERLQTFHDCRHRRKLPDVFDDFPAAARTILACTEPKPSVRPTAEELASTNIKNASHTAKRQSPTRDVQTLLVQLSEKNQELDKCRGQLEEKQCIIDELQRELQSLKGKNDYAMK